MFFSVVLSMTKQVSGVHVFDQSLCRIAWLSGMAASSSTLYIASNLKVEAGVL
jgi:hypothetical protein